MPFPIYKVRTFYVLPNTNASAGWALSTRLAPLAKGHKGLSTPSCLMWLTWYL